VHFPDRAPSGAIPAAAATTTSVSYARRGHLSKQIM